MEQTTIENKHILKQKQQNNKARHYHNKYLVFPVEDLDDVRLKKVVFKVVMLIERKLNQGSFVEIRIYHIVWS